MKCIFKGLAVISCVVLVGVSTPNAQEASSKSVQELKVPRVSNLDF